MTYNEFKLCSILFFKKFNWKDFEKNNCSFDSKLIKFGGCHGCDDFNND